MLDFCASENLPSLNACGSVYAILLSFPSVIIGVRGGAFIYCCQCARMKSSLAAGIAVEVFSLYVHATSDVLSQKFPMCLNVKFSPTYSSTKHPRNSPANSRSFILNLPFWFVRDTRLF